jgi:protein-L-isoaspartate(D-aspartate) O-methyltransferase
MRSRERDLMVELQLAARGVDDARVLAAMATVERERYVPVDRADDAYADLDVPAGYGQVVHRPETIGRALALLELTGRERLLVVGAGSGYPAAVAALLAQEVVATERVPQLAARATRNLHGAVRVLAVDGTQGVAVGAPYDAALVLVAGARAPARVTHDLAPGSRLVHLALSGDLLLVIAGREPSAG